MTTSKRGLLQFVRNKLEEAQAHLKTQQENVISRPEREALRDRERVLDLASKQLDLADSVLGPLGEVPMLSTMPMVPSRPVADLASAQAELRLLKSQIARAQQTHQPAAKPVSAPVVPATIIPTSEIEARRPGRPQRPINRFEVLEQQRELAAMKEELARIKAEQRRERYLAMARNWYGAYEDSVLILEALEEGSPAWHAYIRWQTAVAQATRLDIFTVQGVSPRD